jgi:hypothetical protein
MFYRFFHAFFYQLVGILFLNVCVVYIQIVLAEFVDESLLQGVISKVGNYNRSYLF